MATDGRVALVGAALILGGCSLARAQETVSASLDDGGPALGPSDFDRTRTLNAHAFLPMIGVPWPFVATWVGSRTGVGIYDLPVIPVLGRGVLHKDAKLVAFSQSFDASFALTKWLGLSLSLSAAHAIGANASGAFNVGLNYAYGGETAVVARLLRRRNWYLALRTQASVLRVAGIVPFRLAESLNAAQGQDDLDISSILSEGSLARGTVSLIVAESHTPYLGLQASVGCNLSRIDVDRAVRTGEFDAAVGASLRFNELGAPLALLLGGSLRVRLDDLEEQFILALAPRGKVTGQIETALFYSDPKYVDVGAQFSFDLGDSDRRGQVRFVINHFW